MVASSASWVSLQASKNAPMTLVSRARPASVAKKVEVVVTEKFSPSGGPFGENSPSGEISPSGGPFGEKPVLPAGWRDCSVHRYIAPRAQAVGLMQQAQLPKMRAQFAISSEVVDENATLEDILAARPLPQGVTPAACQPPPAGAVRRAFCFSDPLNGWLIQQSQTFVKVGTTLYVAVLTADPLSFKSAETQIASSKKFLTLFGG